MTNKSYAQVKEFMTIFKQTIRVQSGVDVPEKGLRLLLITEEVTELLEAFITNNRVEIADALGDIVYVTDGASLTFGLPEAKVVLYEETSAAEDLLMLSGTVVLLQQALDANDEFMTQMVLEIIKSACYSIASKIDLNLDDIIDLIHESNLSKLEDGEPVYFTEGPKIGKVSKGKNYVAPTVKIREYLESNVSS